MENTSCACPSEHSLACYGESIHSYQGKKYCILHLPSKNKGREFNEALAEKLEKNNFDFQGVWFPSSIDYGSFLKDREFLKQPNFSQARFTGAMTFAGTRFPKGANFTGATFAGRVNFSGARFGDFDKGLKWAEESRKRLPEKTMLEAIFEAVANPDIDLLSFDGRNEKPQTSFIDSVFSSQADFGSADFFEFVSFRGAEFNGDVDFTECLVRGFLSFFMTGFMAAVRFSGYFRNSGLWKDSILYFGYAHFEKPDRVSFHTVDLDPYWFVDTDPRKFDFTNIHWQIRPATDEAVLVLQVRHYHMFDPVQSKDHIPALLIRVYRDLATNYEETHVYNLASQFRYLSMDANRERKWLHGWFWTLDWWYYLASGYGERAIRGLAILLVIWLGSTLVYYRSTFVEKVKVPSAGTNTSSSYNEQERNMDLRNAMIYSLQVMTLQKPEPKPVAKVTKAMTAVETILGPLQAALLALAVRRKFMR